MMNDIYANLSWLPEPPSNFAAECRAAAESSGPLGAVLMELSKYSLNVNQLSRLRKVLSAASQTGRPLDPLSPFRLGVVSNSTLDFIVPSLEASALRHGIALTCIQADYGQVLQEVISPDSLLYSETLDAVLIAIDYRYFPLRSSYGDVQATATTVQETISHFDSLRNAVRRNSGAISILQTFALPSEPLFGSFDSVLPGTQRQLLTAMNKGLVESVYGTEDLIVDIASLAENIGLARWHSPAQWNMAKLPFADEFVPVYADYVARVLAALRGKSRRCLILDLDNTLWGGVIGDDGLEGIKVAQGDATGEAYLSVQRMALALRERGVVLAVSSKNNDETARSVFRDHPEMLLREEHLAVFQANWNDKATNIKAIAEELSLGLDAMVFLDDNPAERGLVRKLLPQVAVPELPSDPALYARTLSAAGYFESVTFSQEDAKRADFYQDNARRVSLQKQAGNVDDYLASLNMEIIFQPFDKTGRSRIAQLVNKSNQYNLTTRRYTEAEIGQAEADPNCFTLQVRLTDIFGDNGMISVVICRETEPKVWEIDTWLMSCRVLGRGVQDMVLNEILRHAEANSIDRLLGIYIPSARNQMVENHYPLLGFESVDRQPDGSTRWSLQVLGAEVKKAPMSVKSFSTAVA
jgi:FkbH-like protein